MEGLEGLSSTSCPPNTHVVPGTCCLKNSPSNNPSLFQHLTVVEGEVGDGGRKDGSGGDDGWGCRTDKEASPVPVSSICTASLEATSKASRASLEHRFLLRPLFPLASCCISGPRRSS